MAELTETISQGNTVTPSAIDIHDRVADAYYGKMGARFMRETQERIHWICAQVTGDSVLDVGCSQGITSILLGRESKHVLAIDSDARSIEEAKALLELEPERVQEKVEFLHTDFLAIPSKSSRYDTVIISEVLEHLVNPSVFVEAAAECLKPGGTLVVTVPFGINDFVDHKRTYYLLEPYQLLSTHFDVIEVSLLGKWLGLSGRKRPPGKVVVKPAGALSNELVVQLEKAFLGLEGELRQESGDVRTRLHEANLKYRNVTEQVTTYKQRLTQEEQTRKQAQSELALLKTQHQQTSSAAQDLKAQHNELTAQIRALQSSLAERDKSLANLEQELALAKERVLSAQGNRTTEVQALQTALHAATAERREIEMTMVRAQAERDIISRHAETLEAQLKLERKSREDTLVRAVQLEGENKALSLRAEGLHKEAEALSQRLEDALESHQIKHGQLYDALQQAVEERKKLQLDLEARFDKQATDFEEQRRELAQRAEALRAEQQAESEDLLTQLNELKASHAQAQGLAEGQLTKTREEVARLQATLTLEKQQSALRVSQLDAALSAQMLLARDLVHSMAQQDSLQTAQRSALTQIGALQSELAALDDSTRQLNSERDTARALHRSLAHQAEQVKLQLMQAHRAKEELRIQLERAQLEKLAAEDRVARTRAMVSFRLGYTLLHGFQSFSSMLKLPGQLWQLHRDGQRRRASKAHGETTTSKRVPPVAMRTPLPAAVNAPSLPLTSHLQLSHRPLAQALKGLKVACIMDEFTFSSYAPECNLLPLSVDHWQQELEAFVPELLFIESAWRGKDDRWGSKVGHLSSEVTDILAWCRTRQIPTVFWNKEDPIHFETFLTTARLFDHVFTTDIDCIHRYKSALGHERVYLLPFACQPAASNPIEKYERKDAFCFAGAYYVRYPERTRDLGNFMVNLAEYRPVEIYDRNFGKNDPNYQFPADYQAFIVGTLPFDQIDKAYKAYRYAINLNSIKQSQSMFARRVFELLASNTITISNYSRGVRLLFGDLVVTTDSGQEIVRRLQKLCGDPVNERKFRLAGLRKVMRDHTYQDRLAYVVGKVRGDQDTSRSGLLPTVTMTGYAKNQQQLDALLASFERQTHVERRLLVVTAADFSPASPPEDNRVQLLTAREIEGKTLGDLTMPSSWVAGIVPDDYHGPNYLLDLALATRYSQAPVIGKAAHHVWSAQNGLTLAQPGAQYQPTTRLQARCAMVSANQCAAMPLRDWVTSLYTRQLEQGDMLAVDEFNYCKNGALASDAPAAVNDLEGLDTGLDMPTLMARAEAVEARQATVDTEPVLTGAELAKHFKPVTGKSYRMAVAGNGWEVVSELGDGKHEYLYATTDLAPEALGAGQHLKFHLDCTPGLNLQLTVLFLDAHKQRISHVVKPANRNQEAAVPAGTAWVRLGLRLYGSGEARINALVLGHRPLRPATVLGRAEHLLLTNHYPSYDDLYRNGFVHSRVTAYRERGVNVDVFRLRKDEAMSYHEYQNVDVMTGSQDALNKLLSTGQYKSVLVHFLDPAMWEVLKQHIDRIKVVVWVHGAEIQPWHRRDYNFESDEERNTAKAQSEVRMAFWRGLLQPLPSNLRLVFVSRYFAEEVMEDLGFRLPEDAYSIIHNPIDTELFSYQPKPVEQRKKVLSIRPYASRKYANDLSVSAILELSKEPFFSDMEFRLIGDGKLFEATLEPLRKFPNVIIEKRFLSQVEIAHLHKEYGIFLCPTRMDAQGVSRDEAMSSGLAPLTNLVAAIPEFTDASCAMLAEPESASQIAHNLAKIFQNSNVFQDLSINAAARVRAQSCKSIIINAELKLLTP